MGCQNAASACLRYGIYTPLGRAVLTLHLK